MAHSTLATSNSKNGGKAEPTCSRIQSSLMMALQFIVCKASNKVILDQAVK